MVNWTFALSTPIRTNYMNFHLPPLPGHLSDHVGLAPYVKMQCKMPPPLLPPTVLDLLALAY